MKISRLRMPRCKLVIAGGGEREASLRELVSELNLESVVEIVGRVAHEDVPRYYSVMDLLVYPRRRNKITEHVTPLKPLEAMAMGKLILCSDVGGLRELLPVDVPLFFSAGDVNALADQCCDLLQSDKLDDYRELLRRHALEERDWKQMIQRYQTVYELAGAIPEGIS